MRKIFPKKLQTGDFITIIAPSRSISIIGDETKSYANRRFTDLGLKIVFRKHIDEIDEFDSSSVQSRLKDLHKAFSDKKIKAIITVLGGFNSNQLLRYINWDLIKNNPKILCGYSDITALNNAIFAKTGLVNYSGPHYSTFGQKLHLEYTIEYFKKCLMSNKSFKIEPSDEWSDDEWYKNQDDRRLIQNKGYWLINKGQAKGTIIGANLCTLNLLQGTEYMPSLKNTVLFMEDDYESLPHTFDRDLQSVIHQPDFNGVRAIVVGRFQKKSKMTRHLLTKIIKTKKELKNMPVIANLDFGHTDPKVTLPVGGSCEIFAVNNKIKIEIVRH